ncbi:hypothetical protein [Streptomyces sp. ITFR-6]|uniref:hypothetical protein n=1 Tax=Streptomyces sp. ITFR-6 TaxID=3075197 RepID=UPI00288C48B8|nr:hypothetical protein [Streptomyces sp. ITFR-6]WNI27678.1 hypothetical protein RLT59_02000 [Streptomyces sp. ITFR-6]
MTDRRPPGAACSGSKGSPPPIPADMPDQQVQDGEGDLDVILPPRAEGVVAAKEDADSSGPADPDPNAGAGSGASGAGD